MTEKKYSRKSKFINYVISYQTLPL